MSDLIFETGIPGLSGDPAAAAAAAEEAGFGGVFSAETNHDPFLPLPLVAEHTDEVELGTRIALSFTRSPMVLAYLAWDLAASSGGRFALGLGTQVKGHNVRRFSVDFEWEAPGPRLREVVDSLRHIWAVWQGEADHLDYAGEYYQFSLMTDFFDPGPIDHPDVPVYIAGVNDYNLHLAGELCDGLAMHPLNAPAYLEDVILPAVEEGAERAGRSIDDVELLASPLVITGETAEERERSREATRRQIAFYGSTRTYHVVLEHLGFEAVGPRLHDLSVEGKFAEMADLVTDEMLYTFAIEADPAEVADGVRDAYGDLADRASIPLEAGDGI